MDGCEECLRVYCEHGVGVTVMVGIRGSYSAALELLCLTLLRKSLGFSNLRGT